MFKRKASPLQKGLIKNMCGIAGLVYKDGVKQSAMAAVRRMIALQRHRGPDGEGFYDSVGASLGHCRLAIIDLSETGHQPMPDSEGRFWITFNGEIYNYLELGMELRGLGYRFRGLSDTEVLLAAYRMWGKKCLQKLRGMFAFAIWDEKERTLFAARDRLGIKPFHYRTSESRQLAFASELKALLEFLPERRANLRLAREFVAFDLRDHDADETMISGVQRLPPAHYMSWRPDGGIVIQRYWNLEVSNQLETPPNRRGVLTAEFRRRFEESVSIHLRSDVPVGTCLSGGLDSSSIVCVATAELRKRRASSENWQHTFSACFEQPYLDERPYVQAIASATNCRTHFVFPSGERLRDELNTWLWHQEEPVGSFGIYSQYCVARLARDTGIKVLLDGQGADEQLAGYRKFILTYLRQLVRARRYVRALSEAAAFLSSPQILLTSHFVDGRRYLLRSLSEVSQLWQAEEQPERPAALGLGDSLGRRIEADLTRFSLPVLLRYEDRNTMAFGIESRVPFLDHPLVEWLATLPADMRLAGGWTKRILRDSLIGVLPEHVRRRKSKLGFATPDSEWLAGPLADWLSDTLDGPRHLMDILDPKGLKQLLAKRAAGVRSPIQDKILFRLAVYESWARQFLQLRTYDRKRDPERVCI
jgi:asparagine synthase (glutamine-hydrolysing)